MDEYYFLIWKTTETDEYYFLIWKTTETDEYYFLIWKTTETDEYLAVAPTSYIGLAVCLMFAERGCSS
jgi:hypothetical protein